MFENDYPPSSVGSSIIFGDVFEPPYDPEEELGTDPHVRLSEGSSAFWGCARSFGQVHVRIGPRFLLGIVGRFGHVVGDDRRAGWARGMVVFGHR